MERDRERKILINDKTKREVSKVTEIAADSVSDRNPTVCVIKGPARQASKTEGT